MRDPAMGLSARSEADYRVLLERLRQAAEPAVTAAVRQLSPAERSALQGQRIATIVRWGLFDRDHYLRTYADVRAAGVDPLLHYIRNGDAEGRLPNSVFDPRFYRQQLAGTGVTPVNSLYHFAMVGEAAGLSASASFNPARYLDSNPELTPWLERPLTHYLWLGRPSGLSAHHRTRLPPGQRIEVVRPAPAPPLTGRGLVRGINVTGPLDRVSGLAVSARSYLDGLAQSGFGGRLGSRVLGREFGVLDRTATEGDFPPFQPDAAINLFHVNADVLPVLRPEDRDEILRGKYNIAVWYWELPTLRPEAQAAMKPFHEFWAPTRFIADALRRSTARPVRLVPPYLSYLRGLKRVPDTGGPANFLYCFDANSVVGRKNPVAVLQAFRQAFPSGDEAGLTFKITYPKHAEEAVDRLYRAAAEDRRIRIVDAMLSDAELHTLVGSATAYVSPHRSEGLGLTVVEAMAAGVPVIATPWGGIDELVTPDAAYPVDYRLVELEGDQPPYPRGFVWADPDVDSLARALRQVLDDPAGARARAQVARALVLQHFASEALLRIYRAEIERIMGRIPLAR